jgi:cytoskeleton protein RodZ
MLFLVSSCKSLKVLFAICRDIWCFKVILAERGRSLTLRQKIRKTPVDSGDSFKQIGLALRMARRSEGCSVKDISEQLRISVDYLSKLEAGAFDELPAPAYVTGFLRSYGKCVGVAPDSLVARYMALKGGKDSTPSYKTPMSTRPPQRSAPAIASMLVLCAGFVYGGWFWLKTDTLLVLGTPETARRAAVLSLDQENIAIDVAELDTSAKVGLVGNNLADTAEAPAAISAVETTITATAPALFTTKKQAAGNFPSELAKSETTAVESTALKPEGDKRAEIESSSVQTTDTRFRKTDLTLAEAQMPAPTKADASQLILSDELAETQILIPPHSDSADLRNSNLAIANLRDPAKEITIRAVAASWVEIVRDNGEEVMAKLMQAGESYVVEGNTHLYLSTGNAGGLMVVIGADDPLSMGDIGEIVRDLPLVTEKLRKSL